MSKTNDKLSNKQCVRCGEPANFTIKNPATTLYYCSEHYFQEPSVATAKPDVPTQDMEASE